MTPDELIERAAREEFPAIWDFEPEKRKEIVRSLVRRSIRIALEEAINAAQECKRPYSEQDPDEAHNFAIGDVLDAIRALLPQDDGE